MIISIHAEKEFGKIQDSYMITTLSKVGLKGTYLDIIKATNPPPASYSMDKNYKRFS